MTIAAKKGAGLGGSFEEDVERQLEDLGVRRAYEARMVVAELALAVPRMRAESSLNLAELAALIGVTQLLIARVVRGHDPRTPRWDVLRRVGLALRKRLVPEFVSTKRPVPLVQTDGIRPADAA